MKFDFRPLDGQKVDDFGEQTAEEFFWAQFLADGVGLCLL